MQALYDAEMEYSPMGPPNPQEQQPILPASDNIEEDYNRYQQQLKMTFDAVGAGRLAEAGSELMNISRWLLSEVAKLGELDQFLHARMKLISQVCTKTNKTRNSNLYKCGEISTLAGWPWGKNKRISRKRQSVTG